MTDPSLSAEDSDRQIWPLLVNGRTYAEPQRPVAVVCFDGCDPSYLEAAGAAGAIPAISGMMREGFYGVAQAAMPTLTNPNNIAIVCGAPPSVTGIAGNYHLDRATRREVMMLDGRQMRADTILARYAEAGTRVAIVTAKDKLLKALARGHRGLAISAENPGAAADPLGLAAGGHDRYSVDLSLFVLDAGIALLEREMADIIYLSLSDFIQHKHAPDEPEAISFMRAVDERAGRLAATGAVVAIVADHGMSDMTDADGRARVTYVEDEIEAAFGKGVARVICPITDPFTRHHSSLGGFVRVYLFDERIDAEAVRLHVGGLEGVGMALPGEEACDLFDLPRDSEADIVVVAAPGHALGAKADEHDLSQLAGKRLRSHGGTTERQVPFIVSRPLLPDYAARATEGLRNFDVFDFAINGAAR